MSKPTIVPRWADTVATDITKLNQPPSTKQDIGWLVSEKPPAQWFNWLFYNIYLWLVWLQAYEDTSHNWSVLQTFSDRIVVSTTLTNGWGGQFDGNGTGYGVYARGGVNGVGVHAVARGAATAGLEALGDTSGGTGGPGVLAIGGTGAAGVVSTGNAAGAGMLATGGMSGVGVIAQGNGSSEGVRGTGGATNGPGIVANGAGSGNGITATGGSTGHGVQSIGGAGATGITATGGSGGVGAAITGGSAASGAIINNSDNTAATLVVHNAGAGASLSANKNIVTSSNLIATSGYVAIGDATQTSIGQPSFATIPLGRVGISSVVSGSCRVTGSTATVLRGKNVTSVTRIAMGVYRIIFNFAFNDNVGASVVVTANTSMRNITCLCSNSVGGNLQVDLTSVDIGTVGAPNADSDFTCIAVGE